MQTKEEWTIFWFGGIKMGGIREAGTIQYGKNLWGLAAIVAGAFLLLKDHPSFLIPFGTFLIFEHIWNWGIFEAWDFIGHEWIGLVCVIIALFFGTFGLNSVFGLVLFLGGIFVNTYWGKDAFSKELNFLIKNNGIK